MVGTMVSPELRKQAQYNFIIAWADTSIGINSNWFCTLIFCPRLSSGASNVPSLGHIPAPLLWEDRHLIINPPFQVSWDKCNFLECWWKGKEMLKNKKKKNSYQLLPENPSMTYTRNMGNQKPSRKEEGINIHKIHFLSKWGLALWRLSVESMIETVTVRKTFWRFWYWITI